MCALYVFKKNIHILQKQLSWKYIRVKWAKPVMLDIFVEEYAKQYKQNKMKFLD